MSTYKATVQFIDDMGSVSPFIVCESPLLSKEEDALITLNDMRDHDGLEHLKELPEGVTFEPITDKKPQGEAKEPFRFYSSCVSWPQDDVENLKEMIALRRSISRSTFVKHVDKRELGDLEERLGYASHHSQGLMMSQDWGVSYYKSKLQGKKVYFFVYSGIEYVFTEGDKA